MSDIFAMTLFNVGEFNKLRLFASQEGALKAAAALVAEAIDDADFPRISGVDDEEEFAEFRDNLLELSKAGLYLNVLECWDEWVSNGAFEGPTAFNFDIGKVEVEP